MPCDVSMVILYLNCLIVPAPSRPSQGWSSPTDATAGSAAAPLCPLVADTPVPLTTGVVRVDQVRCFTLSPDAPVGCVSV